MLSCQEVQKRFDVFLDGETDGRTMRDLALHVTQCTSCENDLRLYERCHAAFVAFIEREVDRIDVSRLWQGIEVKLDTLPVSRVSVLAAR
ncbi:MAG: zf-HC2 domain-containing protein, partial [Candidatus Binatia bacterium]